MLRYIDNTIKMLASEAPYPNTTRKVMWASIGIALVALLSLAYGPKLLMK